MKTIETIVHEFNELSDAAKEVARDWYRNGFEYPWASECLASLKALAEAFNGKVSDYSVDWYGCTHSSASFDMPEMESEAIADILAKMGTFDPKTLKGHGDCKLTGYCADENAIDGFRIAWHKGERDLNRLMQAGFQTWIKDCQSDCEALLSNEAIDDAIAANEYTFTAEGKRF